MFKIGHSYGEPENMTRQLNGEICEVRIWNVIRSQEEIYKNMYDVDPQTTGLIINSLLWNNLNCLLMNLSNMHRFIHKKYKLKE